MTRQTDKNAKGKITRTCAFCQGTGIDPFGLFYDESRCQVCGGSGQIVLHEPVRTCPYCNGSGVHPNRRMVCTVCGGKGSFKAPDPLKKCRDCHGKGARSGEYLSCTTCGGKGVLKRNKTDDEGHQGKTDLKPA